MMAERKQSFRPAATSLLRAAVLASAAVMLCWPLTVTSGAAAAVVGSIAGALAADAASRPREDRQLRLGSALALAVVVLLLGSWSAHLVAGSTLVAEALGPIATIHLSEAARWLFLTLPAVFALRFAAARRPLLALLEVMVVAGTFVAGFAAHREGMVHRPLAIGDWAWSRGIDPAFVFLALGGLATLLLAALLVAEERRRRLPLHFSALLLVALALLLIIRVSGLPKPQPSGDLGLTGKPDTEEDDSSGRGGGRGQGENDHQLGELQFKDEYSSQGGEAPVAVVLLHDDYSPPAGVYYFRQTVFSQYNGHRLVQSTRDDVDRDVIKRFPAAAVTVPEVPPSFGRQELRTSMGLLIDHVRPFALDSPLRLKPIANPNPVRFQRAFEVVSSVPVLPYSQLIGKRPGAREWDAERWDHYTEAPADPRYGELADQLMERLHPAYRDDPLGQALAIKTYLDEDGIYSRKSGHAGATDPVASFLFGDLTGYCVHFAHAATYLFRSRGVPARVAAGYAVAESSRGTSSAIMIRGADAHAWPEIYLEGVGWVVVDLAPQTSLDEPTGEADPDLQRMLGEMMRQQQLEEEPFKEARERLTLAAIGRFLLRLLLVLLAAAYAVKLYRVLVPHLAHRRHLYRLLYRAALDRLAEIGLHRRYGESRESFAARTAPLTPSFAGLTEQHLRAALGSRRIGDAGDLRRLRNGVSRELQQTVPAWRRVLGALNPISWLMAR